MKLYGLFNAATDTSLFSRMRKMWPLGTKKLSYSLQNRAPVLCFLLIILSEI